MTRLFRNPNIMVGDKVRIHAEPVQPVEFIGIFPNPEEVGSVVVVTAVSTYEKTRPWTMTLTTHFQMVAMISATANI